MSIEDIIYPVKGSTSKICNEIIQLNKNKKQKIQLKMGIFPKKT